MARMPWREVGRREPIGLRTKIALRFAAVALVLSVLLGTITYISVRQLLLDDREASSVDQVVGDARLLATAIGSGSANPSEVLASLRPPSRSTPLLNRNGQWFAASLQVRPGDLPDELTSIVLGGDAARQILSIRDRPVLVVGIPLGEDVGSYFEVFSLEDVQTTLSTLLQVLILAGATATVAGVVLGGWMAGRVLRPLREVTAVASQISEGELDSRLDESLDPDLKVLTASFNRMATTLSARIAREARFASDVAHELRTPLTALLTSLSVLQGRASELSPGGQEALDLVGRDARRLQITAEDLIEVAKHDAGVVTAELEMLPVTVVVNGLLNRIRRPDVSVDIDRAATGAMVCVDERRLDRVLANLVVNAETHGDGVSRISVEGGEGVVRIAVEDRGPGVDEHERQRIFDRFARGSTARRSGSYAGSGLGLALAAENTRLMAGRIWVEDRPGGGARFVVELATGMP